MAGTEFSVAPQELERKAEETNAAILELERIYQTLREIMSGTAGYWIGEGGDTCRRMFGDRQAEIEEMLIRMKAHPQKLLEIAGIYKETEQSLTQRNSMLPTDPFGEGGGGGGGGRF